MHNKNKIEQPKNIKYSLKKLLKYLSQYKIAIVFVILFSILSTIFSIFGPKILGRATTKLFEGIMLKTKIPNTSIDFKYIGNILLFLLGLYILSSIFNYLHALIMNKVSLKVTYNLRNEISKKINKLPLKYFDKNSIGDTLSRVTNDVDTISNNLEQVLSNIVTSLCLLIGILIMMITISFKLTIITLVTLPLSMILVFTIAKKSQKHFKNQQVYLGNLNGHIEESYSAHEIVKAFNGEVKQIEKFDELNDQLYNSNWKSQFLSGTMMPILNFVSNLGYVLVSVVGGYLTIKGKVEIGDMQAFFQYVRQFNQPIMQLSQFTNVFQSVMAASERVFEFLDEEEISNKETISYLNGLKGVIEFNNVCFGYDRNKQIIKNFNITINPGEKIAIVGPTGAGKTTIVNLLMRFYEIDSGSIKIDGIDIKNIKKSELRKIIGMVLQDTWLFNGTINNNIAFGKLDASDEEIIEAATSANVDHFIHTLPDNYNTMVDEDGTNISSGQKQLLTIARAILVNPAILILDEATSNVDTRTELMIDNAMQKLMEGKTSFIIAHRLSTIRDADKILVMNDGNIVEIGNHEELIKKKGYYFDLYNSQFENKIEEVY